uniref:Uncharacterized protein n=1 Tax=Alexandrium monilatum TaxID=311494 RepID=A0A7S4S6Z6_9DINO
MEQPSRPRCVGARGAGVDFFEEHLSKLLTPPSFVLPGSLPAPQGGGPGQTAHGQSGTALPVLARQPLRHRYADGDRGRGDGAAPPGPGEDSGDQGSLGPCASRPAPPARAARARLGRRGPHGRQEPEEDGEGEGEEERGCGEVGRSRDTCGGASASSRGLDAGPVVWDDAWVMQEPECQTGPLQASAPRKRFAQAWCEIDRLVPGGTGARCCRCRQVRGSCFDHACPRCSATVCLECLDDCRLILGNFRCPRCGDEDANRQRLQREIWMINLYRSTCRVLCAISQTFFDACASEEAVPASGADAPRGFGARPAEAHVGAESATFLHASPPGHPLAANPFLSELADGGASPGAPEHGTRLPVDWHHLAGQLASYSPPQPGASPPGRPATAAAAAGDEDAAALPRHLEQSPATWCHTAGAPGGSGSGARGRERGAPAAPPAQAGVSVPGPERGTRLPADWHELSGHMAKYVPLGGQRREAALGVASAGDPACIAGDDATGKVCVQSAATPVRSTRSKGCSLPEVRQGEAQPCCQAAPPPPPAESIIW